MVYNGFSLLVVEGMESKLMIKCYVDKFCWCVWLWCVCYGVIFFVVVVIVVFMGF